MYDREIVDQALALSRQGFSDRKVAEMCGVSVGAVRHWKYGNRRTDQDIDRSATCPLCNDRSLDRRAYSYLLGLYLGDGHIARHRREVHRLTIACCDDWPGLMDAAAEAVAAVMPHSSVGRLQRTGCTLVNSYSKHWVCLFPQHGPGMKHTRTIRLEPWQNEIIVEYTEAFVRGLIHSDGCRSLNRVRRPGKDGARWYEYPRYFFTNESADIRRLFTDSLDRLGIAWKQSNRKTISVARREAVARLDEFVGPKY
ncbi:helix-turn-helix domain-containing protein [Actinoallomurus sp. NPDC052308]|uniref:helix-turn-helix domain-containing protein n=1 Tax=Actinoallomurus sp. NPDC052308 TaxID=3155530 RepID=UPI0034320A53